MVGAGGEHEDLRLAWFLLVVILQLASETGDVDAHRGIDRGVKGRVSAKCLGGQRVFAQVFVAVLPQVLEQATLRVSTGKERAAQNALDVSLERLP